MTYTNTGSATDLGGARAEAGQAEKRTDGDGWAEHVIEPLAAAGFKPPRRWDEARWAVMLAEIGRPHRRRSRAELETIRVAIRREITLKGGRWPGPEALRLLISAVLTKRRVETGGDSLMDRRVVDSVLAAWRDRGQVMGPGMADLRRRCRIVALLAADDGPPVERLRAAGHRIPADLAAIASKDRS